MFSQRAEGDLGLRVQDPFIATKEGGNGRSWWTWNSRRFTKGGAREKQTPRGVEKRML